MKTTGEYVRCGYKHAWIMWDLDNGGPCRRLPGRGYMWVFKTREEARKHRKAQHRRKHYARLSQPFKISNYYG